MLTVTRRAASSFKLALAWSAAVCLLALPVARAQEAQSQPASQPAVQPSNPETHQKALALLDTALAKYRAAKSYQDEFAGHMEVVATDKDGKDVGQSNDYLAGLLYGGANRLALSTDSFSIHCDGKQLWLYTAALDAYTETAAPERVDYDKLTEDLLVNDPPHPILFVLSQPDKKFQELFPMVREFTAVTREEFDGRPGTRLAGIFDASQTPFEFGDELVPFSLWLDEKTGLAGELRLELTTVLRKVLGLEEGAREDGGDEDLDVPGMPKKLDKAVATATFKGVKLDGDIPAERFVFKPEPGTPKVDKFDWDSLMQPPDPQSLLGKPAPAFAGDGLDEKPLSLESLRGRVVVLDFWATWCMPCVQSMPQIQKLADKYADQPVTVIGLNQDERGKDKKIREFLADKKITFRQFLDPAGKLGRKFKVAAIPCTFVLDKQGVVQAVHVGMAQDLETTIGGEIEKLLKGEQVYDPTKPKAEEKPAEAPPAPAPQ